MQSAGVLAHDRQKGVVKAVLVYRFPYQGNPFIVAGPSLVVRRNPRAEASDVVVATFVPLKPQRHHLKGRVWGHC